MHPPAHLKDQLLINGRNHLALKNALLAQHQHHHHQQSHFHADSAASLGSPAPSSSAALFQSAVVAAAAHRQQLAAAAAAAAAVASPPHPIPPTAIRLPKSPQQAGLVDQSAGQTQPAQPPTLQPKQPQQQAQSQHPHQSQQHQQQPQSQPPSQQQQQQQQPQHHHQQQPQQQQPHQLAYSKHASPAFDLSMVSQNLSEALSLVAPVLPCSLPTWQRYLSLNLTAVSSLNAGTMID